MREENWDDWRKSENNNMKRKTERTNEWNVCSPKESKNKRVCQNEIYGLRKKITKEGKSKTIKKNRTKERMKGKILIEKESKEEVGLLKMKVIDYEWICIGRKKMKTDRLSGEEKNKLL